jgi:mutator protein MutT
VACAVIRHQGKILITRRHAKDHLGGLWEFPGGKRLGAESLAACLEREIWEELAIRIRPVRYLGRVDHQYPEKAVSLYFYDCEIIEGNPWPRGCAEWRWIRYFEFKKYAFPAADAAVLKALQLAKF